MGSAFREIRRMPSAIMRTEHNQKAINNNLNMKKLITTTFILAFLALTSYSQDTTKTAKQRPIATYKVGSAKVIVWENKGEKGTWKNFQVEKIYQKDGKWKTTNSFNEKELLELKAAIDRAIAEESVKVNTTEEK